MDKQQLKSAFKGQGDAMEKLAQFANILSEENAKLRNELAGLKSWVLREISMRLDNAVAQLTVDINAISAAA
jgi:hypothetical protein